MEVQTARCDECKAEVKIPDDYAHGDKMRCDRCGAQLRVLRGDVGAVRVVMADSGPLRTALDQNRQQIARLESDLLKARHSIGIGVNGLGIGVLFVIARIFLEDEPLTRSLVVTAVVIALVVGVLLELANHLFLAKHAAIVRLSGEVAEAKQQSRQLQARIREADRPYTKAPAGGSKDTRGKAAATR